MNLRNTLRKTAAATLFAASAVTGVMLGSTAASAYNEAQAAPPVVETVEPAPLEVETASVEVPESGEPLMEDEVGWDCRIHGNEMCGVQIEGTWYVVTFDDGQPVTVAVR